MRIVSAQIDGFGKLHRTKLDLDAPIVIVRGPNETGKSTLFGFVRAMLYGFATRANLVERQEPVYGGRHGGRLLLRSKRYGLLALERYAGVHGGKPAVRAYEPGGGVSEGWSGGHAAGKNGVHKGLAASGGLADQADSGLVGAADLANLAGKTGMADVSGVLGVSRMPDVSGVPGASGAAGMAGLRADAFAVFTQQEWERLLLSGVSDRAFRQLFAVGLTELREIAALQGDELGRYLYHSGLSGGQRLAAAEKAIQQEMDSLYKPRGVNQSVNRLLKEMEQAEAGIRRQPDHIGLYNETAGELDRTEVELRELEARLPELADAAGISAKALAVRPAWMRLQALRIELSGLADPRRLPPDADMKWQAWTLERNRLEEERDRLAGLAERAERERMSMTGSFLLLPLLGDVERLLLSAETVQALRAERGVLEAEKRTGEASLVRLLASISPEWGEAELLSFPGTVADRERVRGFRASIGEAELEAARCAEALRGLAEQERETLLAARQTNGRQGERIAGREDETLREDNGIGNGIADGGASLQTRSNEDSPSGGTEKSFAFVPQTEQTLRQTWERFEEEFREWELAAVRAAHETAAQAGPAGGGTPGRGIWPALAAAAFGIALLAAAFAFGLQGPALAAAVLGALALALAPHAERLMRGGIAGRGRRDTRSGRKHAPGSGAGAAAAERLREREQRVAAALEALLRQPGEAAAALAPAAAGRAGGAPAEAALAAAAKARGRLQRAVDARLEALRERGRAEERRRELAQRLERIRALAAEARAAAGEAADRLALRQAEWERWLAGRGLPAELSPEAALEVFDRAEQGRSQLQTNERSADRLARIDARLADFDEQAAALCRAEPEAAGLAATEPVAALQWLQAAIRKQIAQKQASDRLEERLHELREQREQVVGKLARHDEQASLWFHEAGAADEAEWERLLVQARQARRLQEEAIRLEVELSAGMTAEKRALLDKLLQEEDEHSLALADKRNADALDNARQRQTELLERRGRLLQTSEQLKGDEDRRSLLQQRESALARLQGEVERYAELAVMTALIRRTKKRLEDERQPAVLREASRLAAQLTNGRYVRIVARPGEGTIRLENADGDIVDASFLSRGAAEQIYLALRLALADAVESREPLPMLLDDLFVNFDADRLRAAAGVLARVSTGRQLILLTCHDHIATALAEAMPQAKTVAFS